MPRRFIGTPLLFIRALSMEASFPKIQETTIVLLLMSVMAIGLLQVTDAAPATPSKTTEPAKVAAPAEIKLKHATYQSTTPLDLVKTPEKFLNQAVTFSATFNSFSSLGLDYKKALRDSKDYISMTVLRPDVKHHKVPLSELKLIYPRKQSEAVLNLESGDKVQLKGSIFSTALNDPWMDVEQVTVLEKVEKPAEH